MNESSDIKVRNKEKTNQQIRKMTPKFIDYESKVFCNM